jgi:hypothetical protein
MYTLKGFLAFGPLTNNLIGQTSAIGEISTEALTYAKETGFYQQVQFPDTMLHTFHSVDDLLGVVAIPDEVIHNALNYGQTLFYQSQSSIFNSNPATSREHFQRRFINDFDAVEFGAMRTNGNQWLPEYIRYHPAGTETVVILWLSDAAFLEQYDEYDYTLIPPLDQLDIFYTDRGNIERSLHARSLKSLFDRIEQVRENDPFTVLETITFNWVNPDGTGDYLPTNWTLLIYGRFGQNIDRMRAYIAAWILQHSSHGEEDWFPIFPDIFNPTEFILLPLWHQFAIPNQTVQAGFHSPITTLEDGFLIAKHLARGDGYREASLLEHTTAAVSPDRSLMFLAVASSYNALDVDNFRKLYPDYVGFSPASLDFSRLSLITQNWIHEYIALLVVAETMTETSPIPQGYGRVIRDRRIYAYRDIEMMSYLMITKASAIEHLGIKAPYDPELIEGDDGYCNVAARIIREHLLFEHNAHNVTRLQLELQQHTGEALLTGPAALSTVLDGFEAISHTLNFMNQHQVTADQVGLHQLQNTRLMTIDSGLSVISAELATLS